LSAARRRERDDRIIAAIALPPTRRISTPRGQHVAAKSLASPRDGHTHAPASPDRCAQASRHGLGSHSAVLVLSPWTGTTTMGLPPLSGTAGLLLLGTAGFAPPRQAAFRQPAPAAEVSRSENERYSRQSHWRHALVRHPKPSTMSVIALSSSFASLGCLTIPTADRPPARGPADHRCALARCGGAVGGGIHFDGRRKAGALISASEAPASHGWGKQQHDAGAGTESGSASVDPRQGHCKPPPIRYFAADSPRPSGHTAAEDTIDSQDHQGANPGLKPSSERWRCRACGWV
jgi:hypothetical protein